MSTKHQFAGYVAFAFLACTSAAAFADDHAYTEGAVANMTRIRTADGKFDDYMKYVDTKWKMEQEAAKRAGDVLSYQVLMVEPRTPDDPDLLLVTTFRNWAALDGALEKNDAIAKLVDGSLAAASKGMADRASIRRILGSTTMQVLNLK